MTKHYTIFLTKTAQKQLDKLSNNIANPIIDAIAVLTKNPRPNGCKKLKGRDGYRIQQGNYYEIEMNLVLFFNKKQAPPKQGLNLQH